MQDNGLALDTARGTDGTEDIAPTSCVGRRSAVGRLPRRAQRRVSMVFWPTRASSSHCKFSIAVLAGSLARIDHREKAKLDQGKFFLNPRRSITRSAPCGVVAPISCETPAPLNSRPTVVSTTELRNSSNIQCARSFRRQRHGHRGIDRTIAVRSQQASSERLSQNASSLNRYALDACAVALPSIQTIPGPLALKRRTSSPMGTTWSPTVPIRRRLHVPDGHHRKSQPAQEAVPALVQHRLRRMALANRRIAPDHQNGSR